ncbi:MAG: SocA family protein [Verrucomicrobiales bacterium]|nr:SocA family protein [Verrucomicrobiales bacterium]MCP5556461.1 SocA family protein [Verrucomicrobiaceae bacterium]
MAFPFSHRKTTQALNFFARKSGGEINKLKSLKLVYFADRYHLRRYGRPITGDEYLAMPYGPVASGAKDLAEMGDFLSDDERAYAAQFLAPVDRYTYRSIADVAERALSESDRAAMEWAWQTFGAMERFKLAEYTHRYPEWKRHEAALEGGRETRVPMCYRDFLDDPEDEAEVCHPLSDEDREALAQGIQERFDAERMLN